MPHKPVQQRLPFPAPPGLTCAVGREEPTIWVRRILLWHDVANEPIRNVVLRRGLNIVWSPTGNDPEALATGHAAGKTLFCRLLRYCLGDDSFADPEDTDAIRTRFPDGAVGAEIRLRGDTWVVRRRFGVPRDDRAMKAESVERLSDEGLRGSFGAFRNEVESTVFDEDQRRFLAEMVDVQGAWQYVLAWLTRDQECRIDGLTHWRHPESSSQSPVRNASAETRLNILRVAIGLYSETSGVARSEVARAASRVETARSVARQAEARFEALRDDLQAALGVEAGRIWPPAAELLQDEQTARDNHFQALMALADHKIRGTNAVSMNPAHARDEEQLGLASGELARVKQQIENLEGGVDRKREHAKLLERNRAERWADMREAKHPVCQYDGTPLDVDKAKFLCPLPHLPDPATAERIATETDAERKEIQADLSEDEGNLAVHRRDKAALEEKVKALRQRVETHQLAVAATTSASQAAWATKGMVRRLFDLRVQSDGALSAAAEAKEALQGLQDRQVAGLAAFSTSNLQHWFDYLIQRVVAPEATGTIVLDGNGLHPRIQWRGIRRSVALNSLQIVLFDLAAMLCAVEGKNSRAPAFLVHDSPREGDLDPWTYSRLFEALFELGPDEGTAPFQYVVTTTTNPPEAVLSRVRLQINADKEQQRLFQVDL
jgi:hypothetical protein